MATDRRTLTESAYADATPLSDRISIYAWQRPRLDLVALGLSHLGDGPGPVVDVGWGTGAHTRRLRAERPDLRVVPVDLSAGLGPEVVADVDALPFAADSAGAVLAMHMLYYSADPRAALRGIRRVLRPGGRLVMSTNGRAANSELRELWDAALAAHGLQDPPAYPRTDGPFLLEDAVEMARDVFGAAELVEHRSVIDVPDAEPVLAYVDSTRGEHESRLPPSVSWDDYLAVAEERVRAVIAEHGFFRITGHTGVIVATA